MRKCLYGRIEHLKLKKRLNAETNWIVLNPKQAPNILDAMDHYHMLYSSLSSEYTSFFKKLQTGTQMGFESCTGGPL